MSSVHDRVTRRRLRQARAAHNAHVQRLGSRLAERSVSGEGGIEGSAGEGDA